MALTGGAIAAANVVPQLQNTTGLTSGEGMVIGGAVAAGGLGMMLVFNFLASR